MKVNHMFVMKKFLVLIFVTCNIVWRCYALPKILSAKFDRYYESIIVTFNESLSQSLSYDTCDNVFETNTTMQKLGSSPICKRQTFTTMQVIPSSDATVDVDDSMDPNVQNFAQASQAIQAASEGKEDLKVSIYGGGKDLCLCPTGDLWFNVDESFNQAYGILNDIVWSIRTEFAPIPPTDPPSVSSVTPSPSQNVSTPNLEQSVSMSSTSSLSSNLSSFIQPFSSSQFLVLPSSSAVPEVPPNFTAILAPLQGQTEIVIPYSKFSDKYIYYLRVESKNVFGSLNSTEKKIMFNAKCKPTILLNRVASHQIHYEAIVKFPTCWHQVKSPTFSWSVIEQGGNSVEVTPIFSRPNVFIRSHTSFPRNLKHTIKVNVKTVNSLGQEIEIERSQDFTLPSKPLQCVVEAQEISIGVDGSLVLDAHNSVDPDGTSDAETFVWECFQSDGVTKFLKDGVSLTLAGKSLLQFQMSEANFTENERYIFKLTYSKGGRSSVCQVVVKTKAPSTPQLVVYASELNAALSDPVLFVARLHGALSGPYPHSWECYDKYDSSKTNVIPGGVVASEQITVNTDLTLRTVWLSTLTIPANTFNMHFKMICECTQNGNSASYTVSYNPKLRTPELTFDKQSGDSYDTKFRIRVHGLDAGYQNQPLSFRFGYIPDADVIPIQYLSGWTKLNTISGVRFPMLAAGASSALKVFAHIRNYESKFEQVEKEITINKMEQENRDVIIQKLKNSTIDNLNLNIYRAGTDLLNMVLVTPNLGNLPLSGSLPSSGTQMLFIRLIESYMLMPLMGETTKMVLGNIRCIVNKSNGRLHKDLVDKIKDLLKHISSNTDKLGQEFDFITQSDAMFFILDVMLKREQNIDQLLYSVKEITEPIIKSMIKKRQSAFSQPNLVSGPGFTTSNQLLNLNLSYQRFLKESPFTRVLLTKNMTGTYASWNCAGPESLKCNGFVVTETQYNQSLFWNATDDLITDVYDISMWNPIDASKLRSIESWYNLTLPVKAGLANMDDPVQCFVMDDDSKLFLPNFCNFTTIYEEGQVSCRCNRSGFVVAALVRSLMPIITTESPFPGENITRDMYFYADKERCTNKRLWNFFKPKFKKQLSALLDINPKRLKITGCTPGSIIVHFYIIDVVGEKRNIHIEPELDNIIYQQTFKVIMNKGDDFWMYDINQTTPKPPPPTIPPIGEVTVDWMPIGISIGALSSLFILCIVITYVIHTRLLKKKVFTKVNSDKKKKEQPKEDIPLSRKQEIKLGQQITNEDLDFNGEEDIAEIDQNENIVTYKRAAKKKNTIQPVIDSGALEVTHVHETIKESARLALDESSSEDESEEQKENLEKRKKMFQVKTKALLGLLEHMGMQTENPHEKSTAVEEIHPVQDDENYSAADNANDSGETHEDNDQTDLEPMEENSQMPEYSQSLEESNPPVPLE